jgi:hypothetical protein
MNLLSIEGAPISFFLLYISCGRIVVHVNDLGNKELYNLCHLNYNQRDQSDNVYIRQRNLWQYFSWHE